MAVIYRDDLGNVTQYANSVLSCEGDECQNIIDKINDFITESSNTLKGEVWDKERERLGIYITALEQRKNVANLLLAAITAANQIMENYIDEFPRNLYGGITLEANMIDTVWIDELETEISKAKANYYSLKEKVDAGEEGINLGQYEEIISACETLIKYIDKITAVDLEAYGKYDEVATEITALKAAVSDVSQLFNDNSKATEGKKASTGKHASYSGGSYSQPSNINTQPVSNSSNEEKNNDTDDSSNYSNKKNDASANVTNNSSVHMSSYDDTTYREETTSQVDNNSIKDNTVSKSNISKPDTNNSVSEPSVVTPAKQQSNKKQKSNNTLKAVGVGAAGVAAVGAAGYGAYNYIKKNKDGNSNHNDDNYDDDSTNKFGV